MPLLGRYTYRYSEISATVAGTQVAPGDTHRVGLVMSGSGAATLFFRPDRAPGTGFGLAVTASYPNLSLWYHDVGDIVTLPWFAVGSPSNCTVLEILEVPEDEA